MKAVAYNEYGPPDVMQIAEVEKPTPDENQVLVKVHDASINAGVYFARAGKPSPDRFFIGGFPRPKNTHLGGDVSGRVKAVGENVKQFRPGDEVFGCCHGAFPEYVCEREGTLVLKPANISIEQPAAVPWAALVALQTFRYAGIVHPGQIVLIQGVSGGVGTFAAQIAKAFSAEVTAVCSPWNLDMARAIGADHVIDYTKEDFTRNAPAMIWFWPSTDTIRFPRISALTRQGIYVCGGGALRQIFQAMLFGSLVSRKGGKQIRMMGTAKVIQEDLIFLARSYEKGKITPVIDLSYSLSEVVEEKHAQGKVVIKILKNKSLFSIN